MKIIHFADLHIGVENYGRTDPNTGLSTRLLDFLATFDELVDFALQNHVDAVLFAGDAYKSRDPSQTHQREFATRIAQLANEGIPIVLVVGNHDIPTTPGRATSVEIFPTLAIERVFVAERIATTLLHTRSGPLQIISLPWIRRSSFLAREDTRNMGFDEITQLIEKRLKGLIDLEFERLDPSIPAILVGHVTARGAKVGSERSMMLGHDHSLNVSDLASPNLDYVALGHIHKHQILSENPKVAYAGSLQRVDFSEEHERKGFCVIELDGNRPQGNRLISFTHQPVKARPFLTIDVKIRPQDEDPTDRVLMAIAGKYIEGAVIRLNIELPEELEGRLQEGPIRDALSNAHYIASIQRNVIRPQRTRLSPEASHGLAPLEALRLYLDSRATEQEQAGLLLRHAELLMREELGEETE